MLTFPSDGIICWLKYVNDIFKVIYMICKNQARIYHVYVEKTQRSKLLLLNNAVKGAGSRRCAQAHAAQYL